MCYCFMQEIEIAFKIGSVSYKRNLVLKFFRQNKTWISWRWVILINSFSAFAVNLQGIIY